MGLFERLQQQSDELNLKSSLERAENYRRMPYGKNLAAKESARAEYYKSKLQSDKIEEMLREIGIK